MIHLDPIFLAEREGRFRKAMNALASGEKSVKALIWFAKFATDERHRRLPADAVFKLDVRMVASATTNAGLASEYIADAAKKFAPQILELAIAQAKAEHDQAEAVRKEGVK